MLSGVSFGRAILVAPPAPASGGAKATTLSQAARCQASPRGPAVVFKIFSGG